MKLRYKILFSLWIASTIGIILYAVVPFTTLEIFSAIDHSIDQRFWKTNTTELREGTNYICHDSCVKVWVDATTTPSACEYILNATGIPETLYQVKCFGRIDWEGIPERETVIRSDGRKETAISGETRKGTYSWLTRKIELFEVDGSFENIHTMLHELKHHQQHMKLGAREYILQSRSEKDIPYSDRPMEIEARKYANDIIGPVLENITGDVDRRAK